jgi:hypothetical protein
MVQDDRRHILWIWILEAQSDLSKFRVSGDRDALKGLDPPPVPSNAQKKELISMKYHGIHVLTMRTGTRGNAKDPATLS